MAKPFLKRLINRLEPIREEEGLDWTTWSKFILSEIALNQIKQIFNLGGDAARKNFAKISPVLSGNLTKISTRRMELMGKVEVQIERYLNTKEAQEDNIIAWAYQYLNQPKATEAFTGAIRNGEKLSGESLLAATQFFTDPYMVRHLVESTLPEKISQDFQLQDIRIVDPACGGGNFLVAVFPACRFVFV